MYNNCFDYKKSLKNRYMILPVVFALLLSFVFVFLLFSPIFNEPKTAEAKTIEKPVLKDEASAGTIFISESYSLPIFCSTSYPSAILSNCYPLAFLAIFNVTSPVDCAFALSGQLSASSAVVPRPQIVSSQTSTIFFNGMYLYNSSTGSYSIVSGSSPFYFPYDVWQAGYFSVPSFHFNGVTNPAQYFGIFFRCSSSMDFTKLTTVSLATVSTSELFANTSTEISPSLYNGFKKFNQFKFIDANENVATFAIPTFGTTVRYPFFFSPRNYYNEFALSNEDVFGNGYKEGYTNGKTEGYNLGYENGVTAANEYSFFSLISAVVDAPIKAFMGLLNFNVFGYNMTNFYLSLLTACLIIAIIKMIL